MSYSDEWHDSELEYLDRIKRKEQVIRHIRHGELVNVEEIDEYERRQEVQQQQFDRMVHAMESCAQRLSALLQDFRLVNIKQGKVYGNRFQITQSLPIRIDLKRPGESKNLPTGFRLDVPFAPIASLILINESGGGNIYFSTNEKSDKVGTYLAAGNTMQLDFGEPILEYINLYADATTTLNMILLT